MHPETFASRCDPGQGKIRDTSSSSTLHDLNAETLLDSNHPSWGVVGKPARRVQILLNMLIDNSYHCSDWLHAEYLSTTRSTTWKSYARQWYDSHPFQAAVTSRSSSCCTISSSVRPERPRCPDSWEQLKSWESMAWLRNTSICLARILGDGGGWWFSQLWMWGFPNFWGLKVPWNHAEVPFGVPISIRIHAWRIRLIGEWPPMVVCIAMVLVSDWYFGIFGQTQFGY